MENWDWVKKIIFLVVILGVVGGVGLVLFRIWGPAKDLKIQPKPGLIVTPLQRVVEETLTGTKGTYGVVVKNLRTGEKYERNENLVFDSGSLYKIWLLAAALEQLEEGVIKEDMVLSGSIPVLNRKYGIDDDEAELTSGEMTVTVDQAIQQMIVISHNYSALLLLEKLSQATVSAYIQKRGFSRSSLGETPKTTASDVALFFERLYRGELASPESTQRMLDLFKKQTMNEKMPKYLPKEVGVAHKTGEIGLFSHDGGIIYGPGGDYLVVVLSQSDSPFGAEERISLLTKTVYEYFEGVAQ